MSKVVFHAIWCAALSFLPGSSYAADTLGSPEDGTRLFVEVQFEPELLAELEVILICTTGKPGRVTTRLQANTTFDWAVSQISDGNTFCQSYASVPKGFSIEYSASGEATTKVDENGCQYADVKVGQTNFCHMKLTQDHVPLTVYKKWVGATGDEADVSVFLECSGNVSAKPGYLNQGLPATWQLDNIPPAGLLCSVTESRDESFVSDESDCQDLLLIAGRGEACTMVNTKVVKRIEMLNRYGKVIMILVMLTAGLIAVRRYV